MYVSKLIAWFYCIVIDIGSVIFKLLTECPVLTLQIFTSSTVGTLQKWWTAAIKN